MKRQAICLVLLCAILGCHGPVYEPGREGHEPSVALPTLMSEREFIATAYPDVAGAPLISRDLRDEMRTQYEDYVLRWRLHHGR